MPACHGRTMYGRANSLVVDEWCAGMGDKPMHVLTLHYDAVRVVILMLLLLLLLLPVCTANGDNPLWKYRIHMEPNRILNSREVMRMCKDTLDCEGNFSAHACKFGTVSALSWVTFEFMGTNALSLYWLFDKVGPEHF